MNADLVTYADGSRVSIALVRLCDSVILSVCTLEPGGRVP